eukprot:scaffold282413_cov32-Tisochrysis_lutea.AAC.2
MATAMRRALLSSRPSLSPLCALRLARPGARVGLGSARGCATTSPKIAALVDQIAELSLLEAAQLTDALKVKKGIVAFQDPSEAFGGCSRWIPGEPARNFGLRGCVPLPPPPILTPLGPRPRPQGHTHHHGRCTPLNPPPPPCLRSG